MEAIGLDAARAGPGLAITVEYDGTAMGAYGRCRQPQAFPAAAQTRDITSMACRQSAAVMP